MHPNPGHLFTTNINESKGKEWQQCNNNEGLKHLTFISDKSTRFLKINTETAVSLAGNRMDLIAVSKTFHPVPGKFTFFSSVHGTFSSRPYG